MTPLLALAAVLLVYANKKAYDRNRGDRPPIDKEWVIVKIGASMLVIALFIKIMKSNVAGVIGGVGALAITGATINSLQGA